MGWNERGECQGYCQPQTPGDKLMGPKVRADAVPNHPLSELLLQSPSRLCPICETLNAP